MISKEDRAQILAEAALVREFVNTEGGRAFMKRLEIMCNQQRDAVVSGYANTFDYHKGVLEGLKLALNIPQRCAELAERVKER